MRLNFIGDDGNPLILPWTFPQDPSLGTITAGSLDRTILANGTLVIDTHGPDNQAVQVGSAQLLTNGTVGGFAVSKYNFTGQESALPLETRDAPSYVMAFDNTNSVALGVALDNVSTSSASVQMVLRDDAGNQIGGDSLNLVGSGHTSFVLAPTYPVTANRRGTIEFIRPTGGKISALAVRFTPPGTLTTIPVLANVTNTGGTVPHITSGGGWKTTVVLINTGTAPTQAHLNFFDDAGNPLTLPLTFVQTGTNSSASQVDRTIAGKASLIIESTGPSSIPVQIGSMQLITTDGSVGGYVIFRYEPNGQESNAPFENRGANAYVIPFDHTAGIVTGTAVNNASAQAVDVPIIFRDDAGIQTGTGTIHIPANGHTAFGLATRFPITTNIRGTVEFDTPAGAQINVLGVRTPATLTFTTLPPITR